MSDLSDKEAEVSKMKVADLKKELKTRGLSTEGKKPELIERLLVAIGDSALLDDAVGDHDDILDEDVLSDEDEISQSETPEKDLQKNGEKHETTDLVGKRKDMDDAGEVKSAKKIVLKRNTLTMTDVPVDKKKVEGDGKEQTVTEKKNQPEVTVASLTPQERLDRRAMKFGVAKTAVADKKEARAARFGLPSAGGKVGGTVSSSIDVLKKRAERFGATTSTVLDKAEMEERKRKRIERFGKVDMKQTKTTVQGKVTLQSKSISDDEEKKKLRAQRFQLSA